MNIPEFDEIVDQNDQTEARREHLEKIREIVGNVYPNKFERTKVSGGEDTITNIVNFAPVAEIVKELNANTPEGEKPDQELKAKLNEKLKAFGNVRVSGRLAVPPRVMGKAAFVHLSDGVSRLQIYVRKDDAKAIVNKSVPSAVADGLSADSDNSAEGSNAELQPPATAGGSDQSGWELFGLLDHGDFVGVEGFLFLTNTGELSVHVETIQFLSKALLPMPDKMHGISDPELQRRYRYADLIASSLQIEHEGLTTREVFERRAKLISEMRNYLEAHGYIEVETPMLTPKATGATAEPFETFHKALGIPLYARIAPELYLKRLVVGGFEKVYELNRNFRNEGLSYKHNPEFTMLEFYCAYMDVNSMMDFAEAMIKETVQKASGGNFLKFGDNEINFSKFERISMKDAIAREYFQTAENLERDYISREVLDDPKEVFKIHESVTLASKEGYRSTQRERFEDIWIDDYKQMIIEFIEEEAITAEKTARRLVELFDYRVESKLIQPTFIIDYPKSISPLSKASPENPNIAERFELFINGMEVANGFSELNDPQEQYERFKDQMKERETGDHEAMLMDEDYVRALAYGMPPAAGIGIGIDRLVMLLTDKHSIRDVILFPHMRPEKRDEETEN